MPPLVRSPPLNVMSGITASPRSSNPLDTSGHGSHSHLRQFHTGPTPTQASYDFSPSATHSPVACPLAPTEAKQTPSSAGYFGFVVDPSDPSYAPHSKNNWSPASSSIRSAAARSPLPVHLEDPPTPFQKQTEILAKKLQRSRGVSKTTGPTEGLSEGTRPALAAPVLSEGKHGVPGDDYFSSVRTASPANIGGPETESWLPLSAPNSIRQNSRLQSPTSLRLPGPRASTLPNPTKEADPALITSGQLADLIKASDKDTLLLLDVRTYKAFVSSRIRTAVNLCIPTTLLKRPSFNVTKLSDTFANEQDKAKVEQWKKMKYIIVYDTDSKDASDSSALTALYTLSKFSKEGWNGSSYILKGGFAAFAAIHPEEVDRFRIPNTLDPAKGSLSLRGPPGVGKVAGGVFNCPLPMQQSAVNPFFSNIRQNMDLIDGVGEIPIHLPTTMDAKSMAELPAWLKEIAGNNNGPKVIADRFLKIEKAEQRRMQDALNVSVIYDSPTSTQMKPHTLAGVEKGTKNRYNNIWPYDHSRVKLQDHPQEECDYVNASHISALHTQKHYIASQAPLPSTFRDFWGMVWEQDVRIIVMLTAEEEGGRLKSHKYWDTDEYGPLKLTRIQERKVSLEPASLKTSPKRRSVSTSGQPSSIDSTIPYIIVRTFTLEHKGSPFSPIREITQLQYSAWPDLGAPAHPSHVLGLIEHTEAVVRASTSLETMPARRPVLVHCSAGCGRTGTFCTIDSVISMMKRQRINKKRLLQDDGSDGDGNVKMKNLGLEDDGDWIERDDEDLVYTVVSELRDQRISMVQCLQQYVLCYETVLEWLAKQSPLDSGKRKA